MTQASSKKVATLVDSLTYVIHKHNKREEEQSVHKYMSDVVIDAFFCTEEQLRRNNSSVTLSPASKAAMNFALTKRMKRLRTQLKEINNE